MPRQRGENDAGDSRDHQQHAGDPQHDAHMRRLPAAFDITFLRRMYMSAAFEWRLLLSGSPGEQT